MEEAWRHCTESGMGGGSVWPADDVLVAALVPIEEQEGRGQGAGVRRTCSALVWRGYGGLVMEMTFL
jgi:hypothetical protein